MPMSDLIHYYKTQEYTVLMEQVVQAQLSIDFATYMSQSRKNTWNW